MPELPEVETTRRGIEPHLLGRQVTDVIVREPRLRWPVPGALATSLRGSRIESVERRAKYLLLGNGAGSVIVHLGMSGSLRVLPQGIPPFAHDHLDVLLDDGRMLRYTDPRRFGCWLWTGDDPAGHPLLAHIGPEPLDDGFDGTYLHAKSRGRKAAVKNFIMDGRVVAGVGNIYASEALFDAGIHPLRAAGRVSRERYARLAGAIKAVLAAAIRAGGTTLRDYIQGDGTPGYFAVKLNVYERDGEPCRRCHTPIRVRVIGQRSSYYCPACQR